MWPIGFMLMMSTEINKEITKFILIVHVFIGKKVEMDLDSLTETELTKLLANHLFGKLTTSPSYIIDKNCKSKKNKSRCCCGDEECTLTGEFGDTSIGWLFFLHEVRERR